MLHDPKERVFTLDDIRRLIFQNRRLLILVGFLGALISAISIVLKPPVYKIQATFKEGGEQTGVEYSMRDFLLSGLKVPQESQAFFLMQSHQVLKPILEKYGLQAEVFQKNQLFRQLRDHIFSQFGIPLSEKKWFNFENLIYQGEVPLFFSLLFTDEHQFQVFDQKGRKLADSSLGEPIILNGVQFTCSQVPLALVVRKPYQMQILPYVEMEKKFRKKMLIARQKNCSSIYDITLYWPDRILGAQLVNDLMHEYRNYLKRDRDEVAAEQVSYLEMKQDEICKRFETLFESHAGYLTTALQEKGLLGLEQEMRNYLEPHEEMQGRLLAIDIELERLQSSGCEYKESSLASDLGIVYEQLRNLENEKNILLKSLPPANLLAYGLNQKGEEIFELPWQEASHWEGIDLESARSLYSEYATRLDAAEGSNASLGYYSEKIQDPDFEIGSLSSVLKDPLSQTLIARASELCLLLKEVKYSSEKERERWKEEIQFHKINLTQHLEQLQQVEVLNAEMIRKKIAALQKTTLAGIDRMMSSLQQQIKEAAFQRIHQLEDEKKLLQKKMEQLRSSAADLPQRWKLETWLQLKTEMGKKIMTAMAELVESKTISRHLLHIESKPLDSAIPPLIPYTSMLFPLTFLGAFCSAFAVLWAMFLKKLMQGFPLTGQKMEALGYPFSGELTWECEGAGEAVKGADLETLRELALFIQNNSMGKIIGLIGEKSPNYSYNLAKSLKRAGKKACIVDCNFKASPHRKDQLGLLQWLQGEIEELPIIREISDQIFSGGYSPFGCEFIQSPRFQNGLEKLENLYDYIFLWQCAPIDGAQAKSLLKKSHQAIVSIAGAQTEQLTPLLDWAYHEGNRRITFISSPG